MQRTSNVQAWKEKVQSVEEKRRGRRSGTVSRGSKQWLFVCWWLLKCSFPRTREPEPDGECQSNLGGLNRTGRKETLSTSARGGLTR